MQQVEAQRQDTIPPLMMDWVKIAQTADFFPNTPSMMSIYISQLMCEHMLEKGGVTYYEELAAERSTILYNFLDKAAPAFVNDVDPRLRSKMNIPFTIKDPSITDGLLNDLKRAGFSGLKGHRSLGGLRASCYNS